jgi:formylglycine-generating enzyme
MWKRVIFAVIGLAVGVAWALHVLRKPQPESRDRVGPAPTTAPGPLPIVTKDGMVRLPGGTFFMGSPDGPEHERPVHEVRVRPFWIDEHEVTVAQFERFVNATGYKTEAEKWGWSGAFDEQSGTWKKADGAYWRCPRDANVKAGPNEPVLQVSWNDAMLYATWAGKRLPTEAEYEFASRGGRDRQTYAWGNEKTPGGKYMANFWQGNFPDENTAADGFAGVAPVKQFPPNGFGLYDLTGNAWEWVADWYDPGYYAVSPKDNPKGPVDGAERVIRGGSFMCADNFCTNYRVAGRSHSTPDSGLTNLGFRCARDVGPDGE